MRLTPTPETAHALPSQVHELYEKHTIIVTLSHGSWTPPTSLLTASGHHGMGLCQYILRSSGTSGPMLTIIWIQAATPYSFHSSVSRSFLQARVAGAFSGTELLYHLLDLWVEPIGGLTVPEIEFPNDSSISAVLGERWFQEISGGTSVLQVHVYSWKLKLKLNLKVWLFGQVMIMLV